MFEAARIHFLSDVFVAVADVVAETPFYVVEAGGGGGGGGGGEEGRGEYGSCQGCPFFII